MKTTTNILLALAISAGAANAALTAVNLSFEDDGVLNYGVGVGGTGATGWTSLTDTGGSLDAGDFRTANDPDNWYPDSTAGNRILIIESDTADNDTGILAQQLVGTAEAGTYTWNLLDVGVANFGDDSRDGASVIFGFSLDGQNFIAGSFQTISEGVDIFSPSQDSTSQYAGSVSYTATGLEPNLYIMFESFNGVGNNPDNGRTVVTVGSTTLDFTAVPEPASALLVGLGGMALLLRRRK